MIKLEWQLIETKGDIPTERSNHEISEVNNNLYVIGGENLPRIPIDSTVYCFSFDSQTSGVWRAIQAQGNVPPPRLAHAQAVIAHRIYIFGGRQGTAMDELPLNDLYFFDTQTEMWNQVENQQGSPPPPRSFHKMVSIGSDLFVFGGCGAENRLNDFYKFDTNTSTWTQLPISNQITGRGGPTFQASSCGTKLIVATGYSGQENNDVHIFEISKNQWSNPVTTDQNLFRARSVCPSFVLGNYIIIAHGEVNTSDKGHEGAGDFAQDFVIIDTQTGLPVEYEKHGEQQPVARGWTSMARLSGQDSAVLFGGLAGNDDSPVRYNDTWKLQVTF